MKRVILAAVFLVAFSGFAAAQSKSAKPASKQVPKTVKKSSTVQGSSKHTVLKQEASADAKSDSVINRNDTTIKLPLILPVVSDSTAIPVVKNDD